MLLVRSGKKMVEDSKNPEKTICYHCFKEIREKFCVSFRILQSSGYTEKIPYCLKCAEKYGIIGEIKKTNESQNAARSEKD